AHVPCLSQDICILGHNVLHLSPPRSYGGGGSGEENDVAHTEPAIGKLADHTNVSGTKKRVGAHNKTPCEVKRGNRAQRSIFRKVGKRAFLSLLEAPLRGQSLPTGVVPDRQCRPRARRRLEDNRVSAGKTG